MSEVMVACDVASVAELNQLLNQFEQPIYLKLGMELIYGQGLEVVRLIQARGHRIFLDLKLHDIPNTVYHAMKQLAQQGIDMVNVHAAGGIEMMTAAAKAVHEVNPQMQCIAVTILTSLDDDAVRKELQLAQGIDQTVLHYAYNAKKAGLDGVVCSVHEVQAIKALCGEDFITVTPGIVLDEHQTHDQKRVATPSQAQASGSDYLVIGRAITQSTSPYHTYHTIQKELAQ